MIVHPSHGALPDAAGGKAKALARLADAGFNPPAFFVILPDAFDENGLKADHTETLVEALSELGDGPFAVRSSGAQEDGAEHSHAGQFLSVLNVDAGDVAEEAHKVWRSGMEGSVADYRATRGLEDADLTPSNLAPAVVIQRMIDAHSAGVAFSADPVSGLRHHTVISAIAGLGDRLVSGEEDGETWTVDTVQQSIINTSETDPVLTSKQVLELADLAGRVEQAFGSPQDIEWAYVDNTLHILQARPITTALKAPAHADTQTLIFDNSNIVESYPGLVTPLTYSFAQYAYARVYRAFVRMVGVREDVIAANATIFENMLGRIDGRVYYNLVNWYRALALLPGFAINRAHMETMMGVSEPLPASVTASVGPGELSGLARWGEYGRMARAGFGLLVQAMLLKRTIAGFEARLEEAIGPNSLDATTASLSELAGEYRRIEASLLDRWDAPIVNDFLCMMAFGASRKMMERWFGQSGLELHNHVMIGQGDIISAQPAKRIATMGAMIAQADGLADAIEAQGAKALRGHSELQSEFDAYIARFGDRCTQELKLESITLDEDPSSLLSAMAAAARRPTVDTQQAAPTALDFATVAKGKPLRRGIAKLFVGWAKARVRDRENLRFERTRIFGRARKVLIAMGRELTALGHLDDPRDVLYLSVTELLGAMEGFTSTQDIRALAKLRRMEMEESAKRPDPDERLSVTGAAINVGLGSSGSSGSQEQDDDNDALKRSGTACSAGVVTAKARVIDDPSTQSLNHGDVLVARHTDPGWIAVFANASAIVVERGSLLSHSAIVAREMGIPCVVALKGATRWIKDGETITVDGATGEVVRVADPERAS